MKPIAALFPLGFAAILLIGSATTEQPPLQQEIVIMVTAEDPLEEVKVDAVMLPGPKPLREVQTVATPCEIHIPGNYPFVAIFESHGAKIVVERFVKTDEGLRRTTSGTGYRVLMGSDFPEAYGGLVATWPEFTEAGVSPVYTVKQP